MSTRATVEGIEMEVVAPNNLLIKAVNVQGAEWGNTASFSPAAEGKLSHGSSHDGLVIYTVHPDDNNLIDTGDGSIPNDLELVDASTLNLVDINYFVDYKVRLANTGGATQLIKVAVQDLEVESTDLENKGELIKDAVRVAILEVDEDNNDSETSKGVYSRDERIDVEAYSAPKVTTEITTDKEYVDGNNSNALIELIGIGDDPGDEDGTLVTIRVWIEGQDGDTVTGNAGGKISISFAFVVVDEEIVGP